MMHNVIPMASISSSVTASVVGPPGMSETLARLPITQVRTPAETVFCFNFPLCLSRACLGKCSVFWCKMARERRFRTTVADHHSDVAGVLAPAEGVQVLRERLPLLRAPDTAALLSAPLAQARKHAGGHRRDSEEGSSCYQRGRAMRAVPVMQGNLGADSFLLTHWMPSCRAVPGMSSTASMRSSRKGRRSFWQGAKPTPCHSRTMRHSRRRCK